MCESKNLVFEGAWVEKIRQLYQIQKIHHGLMLVGPSGSGKTLAREVLLDAMTIVEGIPYRRYVIDAKVFCFFGPCPV